MSGSAKCSKCGRPIIWAVAQRGSNVPWDPEPNPQRGTHVLVSDTWNGNVRFNSRPPRESDGPSPKLYVCHFVSCPFSNKHRRKKG